MAAVCDELGGTKSPMHLQFFSHELKNEQKTPLETKITGVIPKWLTGGLNRVGPGKFKVGPYSYKSWFDGQAVVHRFSFKGGAVLYQNRFLQSTSYLEGLNKTYIVKAEFGTASMADPCKSLFQKFMSCFDKASPWSDNCNVNIFELGGVLRASTETSCIHSIDKESLDSVGKTKLYKQLPLHMSTAHPHSDADGTGYNMGTYFIKNSVYQVFETSPKSGPDGELQAKSLGSLTASYPDPSYYHSFGMTENYFILVEQPFFINLFKLRLAWLIAYTLEDALYFDDRKKTVIRVFCRRTGKALRTKYRYTADPFFMFHHINAYEEEGHIVFDVCGYNNPSIMKRYYFANLVSDAGTDAECCNIRRFVLPIEMEGKVNDDINRLPHVSATAVITSDGSVHCTPEMIFSDNIELPVINYGFNGKKYKYAYGIGGSYFLDKANLTKVNVEDGSSLTWQEDKCFPSEPVFVAHPEGGDEDNGVILSLVIRIDEENPESFLLVLDAASFQELGRASMKGQLPATAHGSYQQ